LCGFEALAEELEVEEAAVRVMLHALERAGALVRGEDFTLEAAVLLNRSPDEIAGRLDADDKTLFERLRDHLGLAQDQRVVYRALPFASLTDRHPFEVDSLLHRLGQSGELIFRGFQRGMTFAPGSRANAKAVIDAAAVSFVERFRQFSSRLEEMIRYAEMRADSGRCRAAFLVDHLAGEPGSPRCGVCDLCAPDHSVPWSAALLVDPEPLEIEPTMAILEAAPDHDGLYGIGTLKKILLGEAYGRRDGKSYALSAYARNSEHFGALRGTLSHERLQDHFDRLVAGGQLETIEKSRGDAGGVYRAIRLTDRGRDILAGAVPISGSEEPVTVNS